MEFPPAYYSTFPRQDIGRLNHASIGLPSHIECKSVPLADEEIYVIVLQIVKELYLNRAIAKEELFLTHNTLSFGDKTFIKHLAFYLCHVVLGHSMRRIARGFGCDRTTISYACRKIEDKRDDAWCDAFVSACERLIGIVIKR